MTDGTTDGNDDRTGGADTTPPAAGERLSEVLSEEDFSAVPLDLFSSEDAAGALVAGRTPVSAGGVEEDDADALAELARVEEELDTRWGETTIAPSLDRITRLMELLGDPHRAYPVIQIAGTNGKTSVSRMVDALLRSMARRTGRTTSPHLQRVTERISIDGVPISAADYVRTWEDIKPFVEMVDADSIDTGGPRMTKFEVLTGLAYAAFADAPIEVGVVEVGMGGRWDATSVAHAEVAVVCPIGYDHQDYLGDTLTEIAGEKAGIITRPEDAGDAGNPHDVVAILARQEPEAATVLLDRVADTGASVARAGQEFGVMHRSPAVGGQLVTIQGLGGVYEDLFLPLHGEHQADNAALALAAVEAFFGAGRDRQLNTDAVREGFAAATSPGRLERVRTAPTVLLDAAHNRQGAAALAAALEEEFGFSRTVGVLSVMGDKDVRGMLEEWADVFDDIIITHNGSPRALDPDALAELARDYFDERTIVVEPSLPDALAAAVEKAEEGLGRGETLSGVGIVVTGSVVTAGAARTLYGRTPA